MKVRTERALTGTTGLALVASVGEALRWWKEAETAAEMVRQAAYSKATEAGALQEALQSCQQTLISLAQSCGS